MTHSFRLGFPVARESDAAAPEFVVVEATNDKASTARWLAFPELGHRIVDLRSSRTGAIRAFDFRDPALSHRGFHFSHFSPGARPVEMPRDWEGTSDTAACMLALSQDRLVAAAPIVLISCECAFSSESYFVGSRLGKVSIEPLAEKNKDALRRKWAAAKSSKEVIALVLLDEDAETLGRLEGRAAVGLQEANLQAAQRPPGKDEPMIVRVRKHELPALAAALGCNEDLFQQSKPKRLRFVRNAAAILGAMIAVGAVGAGRLIIDPPCIPMDVQCFFFGNPHFPQNEVGVLIEQSRIGALGDLRETVKVLEGGISSQYSRLSGVKAASQPNIRVVAVRSVSPELLREAGALLGFSGPIELRTNPTTGRSDYHIRLSQAFLNVGALAGNIAENHGPRVSWTVIRTRNSVGMVDYEEDQIIFAPALINRLLDSESGKPTPRTPVAVHRYPIRGTLDISYGGVTARAPQNLNYSFHRELMGLEEPRLRSASRSLSASPELSWLRVIDYSVSGMLLRDLVDPLVERTSDGLHLRLSNEVVHRAWEADNSLPATGLGNPPPAITSLAWQAYADVALYSFAMQNPACDWGFNDIVGKMTREPGWPYNIHSMYATAAGWDPGQCGECYLSMAQLMNLVGERSSVMQDLDLAIESSEGLERSRFAHLQAKYFASTVSPDDPEFGKVFSYLDRADADGLSTIAAFERARWMITWGRAKTPSDTPDAQLRRVLQRRPRHLMSRFLLAKMLISGWHRAPATPSRSFRSGQGPNDAVAAAASGGWVEPAGEPDRAEVRPEVATKEASLILMSILADLSDNGSGYSEELHWLGEGDEVFYSVDPTYVVEELVELAFTRCDRGLLTDALARTQTLEGVDWPRIVETAKQGRSLSSYYLFPARNVTAIMGVDYASVCASVPDLRRMVYESAQTHIARE